MKGCLSWLPAAHVRDDKLFPWYCPQLAIEQLIVFDFGMDDVSPPQKRKSALHLLMKTIDSALYWTTLESNTPLLFVLFLCLIYFNLGISNLPQ